MPAPYEPLSPCPITCQPKCEHKCADSPVALPEVSPSVQPVLVPVPATVTPQSFQPASLLPVPDVQPQLQPMASEPSSPSSVIIPQPESQCMPSCQPSCSPHCVIMQEQATETSRCRVECERNCQTMCTEMRQTVLQCGTACPAICEERCRSNVSPISQAECTPNCEPNCQPACMLQQSPLLTGQQQAFSMPLESSPAALPQLLPSFNDDSLPLSPSQQQYSAAAGETPQSPNTPQQMPMLPINLENEFISPAQCGTPCQQICELQCVETHAVANCQPSCEQRCEQTCSTTAQIVPCGKSSGANCACRTGYSQCGTNQCCRM
uniref:Cysteine rich repeat-containing domain protein n=1 Tax=Ascaris lumbricoides TaxID=6252 RepID=A0A0M3IJW7_ASCLU